MTKRCGITQRRSDHYVEMFAQTFTGTPNFNVQFWRQPTGTPALRTNLGAVQTTPGGTDILRYNYLVDDVDIDIEDFGATLTDACGGPGVEEYCTVALNPFTSIVITPATATVQIDGGTQSISAACDGPACPTLTWSSDNVSIATVSGTGTSAIVTGHAVGNTNIKATSASGIVGSMVITVVALTSIDVTPTTARIEVGGTQQLSAVCNAGSSVVTCPTLTWSSTDINIATVDSNGLVTGVSDGTTNIKATSGFISSNESAITVITTSTSPSTSPTVEEAGLGTGGKIVIVGLAVGLLYVMMKGKK